MFFHCPNKSQDFLGFLESAQVDLEELGVETEEPDHLEEELYVPFTGQRVNQNLGGFVEEVLIQPPALVLLQTGCVEENLGVVLNAREVDDVLLDKTGAGLERNEEGLHFSEVLFGKQLEEGATHQKTAGEGVGQKDWAL